MPPDTKALEVAHVIVPATGQALRLDSPNEDLAALIYEMREFESQLREIKQRISRELHSRMDKKRSWTLREGDYEIQGESDAPKVEYDVDALSAALDALVEEGRLDPEAKSSALVEETKVKVSKRGLEALRKNPQYRELIDACGEEVPKEVRRLKVDRKR